MMQTICIKTTEFTTRMKLFENQELKNLEGKVHIQ